MNRLAGKDLLQIASPQLDFQNNDSSKKLAAIEAVSKGGVIQCPQLQAL